MKKITLLFALLLSIVTWQIDAQITSFPYVEDFESGDGGWVADNTTNGTWALGDPAGTTIIGADSGTNAWATNLTGTYNANENSWVTSPVFDLSSLVTPSIELAVWWNSEFSWDGMVLQSSIDSGASWQNVGAVGDPNNWYTDNSINGNPGGQQEGWSGRESSSNGSGGWVFARHSLTGLGGQSNVIFRVAFGSDGSVQDDGVAFDTVSIFEVTCPDPTAITLNNITDTSLDISWTAGNTETNWEIVVQPQGTGVPTGPGTAITTNPYTVGSLTPSTSYEIYILADCLTDGQSSWVGPINFNTTNVPPPPPNGVTCASGTSSFIFTEDFETDPAAGWTGTTFTGGNGDWDITAGNANSGGTGPNASFNGGMHLEYEASGDSSTIASAISPAIDLSAAVDGAELSFYMHAFGADMGTLNVGIANDPAGPFTNLYTWIGDFQATDDEAWVPIGINLDAYLGQVVYIEFSYGGAGTGFEGDMSIDYVRVESCGSFCIAPSGITVSNVTGTSADVAWTGNNGEAEWEYVVQPAGTGEPTGSGTVVNTPSVNLTGLNFSTDYEIYVRANCGSDYSVWAGPVNFSTTIQVNYDVDCAVGPTNMNYCYVNNETNVFTFTSTDGSSLNFTVNAGQVEDGWDEFIVYDTDGTELTPVNFYGNAGDLAGVFYQSTGDTISFTVTSDGVINCSDNGYTPIDVTVACATCDNPVATYTLIEDCANAPQFFIDVDITDLGTATTLNITDNQASPLVTATNTGIVTMGPYPNGTDVIVTIENADDSNCIISSNPINLPFCGDTCTTALPVACGDSVSGSTVAASDVDEPADFCGTGGGAPGVWYSFTGTGDIVTMSLCNSTYDTKIQVWEGDCDNLTCVTGNDDNFGACGGAQSEVLFVSNPGTEYLVYVFGFGSSTGDYTLDVTCETPPTPPANDECDNATTFVANADDTCTEFASGTTWGATGSSQANGCDDTADDDDVWFQFDAVSTDHAVTLNNIVGGGLAFVLYEGDDCNNLTQIDCSPFFGDPTIIANGLTVGNTYTVRVYSSSTDPLQNITFDLCVFTIPPPIYTSETDYTVEQIIIDVLANENPDCPQISNITYSTGTDFGTTNGIGYFEANGSGWPFEAGLIMTSGDINNAPGPEDETLSDGGFAWPGDTDLENAVPTLNPGDSNNASIIEFDFVPIIEHMSFDFIFAAEEYGTFQCGFSDAFAFLLTDSNGVTTNLAIVPGTTDPVSVFTVRDDTYNGNCPSVNPEFFDSFYGDGGVNPINAPIDFRGHTTIMTAEATVVPNEIYHIKLVIADALDTAYDSAVFIGAGTFNIGRPDLGDDITLGSGEETCEGNAIILDSGDPPTNADIAWYMDGELLEGENTQFLEVTETAFYAVEYSYSNLSCAVSDEILVEFYENPEPEPVQETIVRCADLEVTLEVVVNNSEVLETMTYYWTYNNTDVQSGPDNTYTLPAGSTDFGDYIVTAIDERGCYGNTTISVIEGTYPIVEAVDANVDKCINEDVTLEAFPANPEALSDDLTYTWYIGGVEMQSSSDNTYVHAAGESEAVVTVMITDELSQCMGETDINVVYYVNSNCLDLPQGISPGSVDGLNDCLILDHLADKEGIRKAEVFNRYGTKVYEFDSYVDQWCGTDEDGKLLPVGTYFYTIYFNSNREPITSWIYLNY
ncbi:choice-of-anchor L domain-containing protein [Pontimicrobium sp. IMCC45349]|uniref:choice-of-anchor L domain-containing protein n=1 Tax=Pontimicrobium sp. IMCC45349 TaxID=3391574 RepID=UPI0039A391C1